MLFTAPNVRLGLLQKRGEAEALARWHLCHPEWGGRSRGRVHGLSNSLQNPVHCVSQGTCDYDRVVALCWLDTTRIVSTADVLHIFTAAWYLILPPCVEAGALRVTHCSWYRNWAMVCHDCGTRSPSRRQRERLSSDSCLVTGR